MLSNKRRLGILALIITNIIWGFASPIFKLALQNIPPFTLAYLRFLGAALILLPFSFKKLEVKKEDLGNLFLLSLFGITINITFFFFGLARAPSINAPIIASAGPVFVYLFSIIFLHEAPRRRVVTGLILSLLGVLTIVGQPIIENGFNLSVLGNVFFVVATIGAVGHIIFSKKILSKYSAITITFWSFVIGACTFLPFFIYELLTADPFSAIDYRGWTGLVFGILFSSTAAYLLFAWGVKQLQAQEVGIFTYIDPLAAILLAIPLLGETITLIFIIGSTLVFLGIFIAEGRIHWHPIQKLR